jgi:ketosteroid isomerase-like protein
MSEHSELLRRCYDSFNSRDIDAVIAFMHPDVDWPNGMEGGRVHGHDEVRDYWTRQFGIIDGRVEPRRIATGEDGRVVVEVHQVVHDTGGNLLSDGTVWHVYIIRDGLIERMDIEAEEPTDS